jgi:hypothetical protein
MEERLQGGIVYISRKVKFEGPYIRISTYVDQKLDSARVACKQQRTETTNRLDLRQISATADTLNQFTQEARFTISSRGKTEQYHESKRALA